MKVSDRVTGLILVVLGALAYYGGSLLPPVPGQQVGPEHVLGDKDVIELHMK